VFRVRNLKGFSVSGFCHESVFPEPLNIPLRQLLIITKILGAAMGDRNRVDIRLSYRPASLCSLAIQFQTRFLESIPSPIAGLKIQTLEKAAMVLTIPLHQFKSHGPGVASFCLRGAWRDTFAGFYLKVQNGVEELIASNIECWTISTKTYLVRTSSARKNLAHGTYVYPLFAAITYHTWNIIT